MPEPEPEPEPTLLEQAIAMAAEVELVKARQGPWYNSREFWYGVGIVGPVVAAVIYAIKNQGQDPDDEPVTGPRE